MATVKTVELLVVRLQCGPCIDCSDSILNSVGPTINNVVAHRYLRERTLISDFSKL